MAGLSDHIAAHILFLLNQEENEIIEIQRNELANFFKCQPSQINYVLSTRFTTERGYIIESQRGGNGYIRIRKISFNNQKDMLHRLLQGQIGESLTQQEALHLLHLLKEKKAISEGEEVLLQGVVQDNVINIPPPHRHVVRANMIKAVIEKLLM